GGGGGGGGWTAGVRGTCKTGGRGQLAPSPQGRPLYSDPPSYVALPPWPPFPHRAPLLDEVPVKNARRRQDRTSHVLFVSVGPGPSSEMVRPAGRPDPPAGTRGPGPVPRSFPTAGPGLSARATALRLPGSPIGHPGRRGEEPQSFDLFKLGQKVGGCIIGPPRQVKPRSSGTLPLFWRVEVCPRWGTVSRPYPNGAGGVSPCRGTVWRPCPYREIHPPLVVEPVVTRGPSRARPHGPPS